MRFVFVVIRRAATRTTTTDTTNTDTDEQYVVPACRASAKRLKARAGNEWTMEFRFPNIHAGQNGRAKERETVLLLLFLRFCASLLLLLLPLLLLLRDVRSVESRIRL